jgi:hypothetical protein
VSIEAEARSRARNYWRADGIPLLLGALIYLFLMGAFRFLWSATLSINDFEGNWFFESLVGPFVFFAIATLPFWLLAVFIWIAGNWEDLVEWFKLRLTYPRTGYVTPPSYWDGEVPWPSGAELTDNSRNKFLRRMLTIFGGFWFWAFVQCWKWRPPYFVMLIILLITRGLRYKFYPEPDVASSNEKTSRYEIRKFLKEVSKSYWIWFWVAGILSHLTSNLPHWIGWSLQISIILLAAHILFDAAPRLLLNVLCCAMLCAFFFWHGTVVSTTLALFVPGIYAAFSGAFRLVRYLRANPLPQQ